jgi:hypothetical protein
MPTMMTSFKRLIPTLAVLALAACGGGNGDTSPFGGDAGSGGGSTPTVTVANLSLALSAPSIGNSGSETLTATATATNANNQTVSGAEVVLSVDSSAQIAVDGSTTDNNGRLSGSVGIGNDRSNRTVTVTATANNGALIATKTFQVVGAKLSGTLLPAVLTPGQAGVVKYRLVDASTNPMADVQIVVTGPGGVETVGTTGSNGDYDYAYTAPTTTGDLTLTAAAGGDQLELTALVQSGGSSTIPPVDSIANTIRSASVSASPSVVAVNTTATNNQAQLRALFLTNANTPVKNIRVRFDLAGDANSIGGSFSTGDSLLYSDANGVATASYIPGTRASPTDGVTVRACWDYVDFAAGACPNSATATLTVVADPVSVSIGTNNLLQIGSSGLTYVKRYVVQVVDSSGVAKPDVLVTPSIDLRQYFKGFWTVQGDSWTQTVNASCDNEDLNRNNTNEIYSNGVVEDANGSFNLTPGRPALEPRKADVAISFDGPSRTDTSGEVVIKVEYPQDLASWVSFNILVTASGVSATEGRANYAGILPVLAAAVSDKTVPPAFVLSPYGVQSSPVIPVTNPQGQSGLLCTNPN